MKIELEGKKLNLLLQREELQARIDYKGSTPSKKEVLKALAKKLSTKKFQLRSIQTLKGRKSAIVKADRLLEEAEEYLKKILQKPIPQAVKEIQRLEKPNMQLLLKLEKEGKNRKGMKEFLRKNDEA